LKVRRLGNLQRLRDLGHLAALGEQPVGFPQLANDLLGRMTSPLHVLAPLTHSTGSTKLSKQPDRTQGVAPAVPNTRRGAFALAKLNAGANLDRRGSGEPMRCGACSSSSAKSALR
jgi:hypothetical protein